MPILDELCFRLIGFVSHCLSRDCPLTTFVARHGLISGMRSLVGCNASFCQMRYGHVVDEILHGAYSSRSIKR